MKTRKYTILAVLLLVLTAVPCFLFTWGCSFENLPASLIALRKHTPEAAEFVAAYPTEGNIDHEIDLSAEYTAGEIPLLLQWDTRWGYEFYGDDMIAITGCGPVCLSMAAVGLTGNIEYHPLAVANYAEANGYYYDGVGSAWTLISTGAQAFGLKAEELPLSESVIRSRLAMGQPVICAVGPGDFTVEGHFIIITELNADGTVTVNDPNSRIKSQKRWELQQIMNQMQNLWAMSAV